MAHHNAHDAPRFFAETPESLTLRQAGDVLLLIAEAVRGNASKRTQIFKKLPDLDLLSSLCLGLHEIMTDTEQKKPLENIFHDIRLFGKQEKGVFETVASLEMVATTLTQVMRLLEEQKAIRFGKGDLYFNKTLLLKQHGDPRKGIQKFLDHYAASRKKALRKNDSPLESITINTDHLIGGSFALSLTGRTYEAAQLYTFARVAELFDDQLSMRDLESSIYSELIIKATDASRALSEEFAKLADDIPEIGKPDNVVGFTSFLQDMQAGTGNTNEE